MKIAKVKSFLFYPGVQKNLLLCRIETTDGVYGWGEGYVVRGKEKVTKELLDAVAPALIGRSVFDIRHMRSVLFTEFTIKRSSVDFFSMISAIEIAMWDIVGKYCGQPVYNLLGGRHRERIRVYANGWWKGATSIEETVRRAAKLQEEGFNAVKWDPFNSPWREQITREQEDYAVRNVATMRKTLGDKMDLLVECHRRLSPYHAIHFAKRIEEYDPFLLEEPCCSDNIDLVAEVKRNVPMRVMSGETCYTLEEFKTMLNAGAVDVINPDTCCCSGISGMLEIAHMAQPYSVMLSPHNYNSSVIGLAATVHLSVATPNFTIAELFVNIKPGCDSIAVEPMTVDKGFVELPTKPGLGVDIDMKKLAKQPYEKIVVSQLSQYFIEYPRKEDFAV